MVRRQWAGLVAAFAALPCIVAWVSSDAYVLDRRYSIGPQRWLGKRAVIQAPSALRAATQSEASVVDPMNTRLADRQPAADLYRKRMNILSQDPLVYTIPDFFSAAECDALVDYAQRLDQQQEQSDIDDSSRRMKRSNPPLVDLEFNKLAPPLAVLSLAAGLPAWILRHDLLEAFRNVGIAAIGSLILAYQVLLPWIRSQSDQNRRTSRALALNNPPDNVSADTEWALVKPLLDRISELTGHTHWEAPVVTCYDPGAVFSLHQDASLNPQRDGWDAVGGQRVVTVLAYLNTVNDGGGGGETAFDRLGIQVTPQRGAVLVFFPADSLSLQPDDRLTHESLAVMSGEKWIVQIFGRIGSVPPPLGVYQPNIGV